MTKSTLFLFVSCCVEQSRFDIMKQVLASIKNETNSKNFQLDHDLLAFDNGSTVEGTRELLLDNFSKVYVSDTNEGYWSAIFWLLNNYEQLVENPKKYRYVYIIESDHFHYAIEKLNACEQALDQHENLGSIRTSEYVVAEQHLYNKSNQDPNGRKYAWVSHVNTVTSAPISLKLLIKNLGIYNTNFLTCLHSVNRLEALKEVFIELQAQDKFSEHDFQKLYHNRFQQIGLVDGGIFHAKLGFTPGGGGLSGSWSHDVSRLGYKTTRQDKIRKYTHIKKL